MQNMLPITRQRERLLGTREVARRLGVSYHTALEFMHRFGFLPTGRAGGHLYITQEGFHRALTELERGGRS